MKNKKIKKVLFPLVGILLVSALFFVAVSVLDKRGSQEEGIQAFENEEEVVSQSDSSRNTIVYEGNTYEYNSNLENYLFLGVDKKEEVVLRDTPGIAGQADCVMVLSMDRETKEGRILQISRDSMTDVDIYDANGNYYTTIKAQIAAQYAYGNGKDTSCWAMKKTVSKLLYDLPLDGCISLNIEGIRAMNDAVGGVTVTIPEDYTAIDPAFVKGNQITLTGEQAERYVRYRDTERQGSNHERMRRQVQYLPALISAIRKQAGNSGDFYGTYQNILAPYMVTDMNADQINRLSEYQLSAEVEYVPGEAVPGEYNEEFIVNEEELKKLLIKMFYKIC